MPHTRTATTYFTLLCVVFLQIAPAFTPRAIAVTRENSPTQDSANTENLPPFPEDAARPATNWANVDWDKEIILPQDQESYLRSVRELEQQNKYDEIGLLVQKHHKMSDDEVMTHYAVPTDVRNAVREYVKKSQSIGVDKRTELKRELNDTIMQLGFGKQFSAPIDKIPDDLQPNNIIDISTAEKLQPKKSIPIQTRSPEMRADTPKKNPARRGLMQSAKARVADNGVQPPFIAHYDGIEKHTMDFILYNLSQNQNADGSFGSFNQYELTAEIALLLTQYNRTDSGQFTLMINYLKTTEPANNREKAMKARLLVGLGQPYQQMLDELLAEQNQTNGGFALLDSYGSDALTTMEAALALWTANYQIETKLAPALLYVLNQIQPDGSMYYTAGSKPSWYLINKIAEGLKPFQSMNVSDGQTTVSVQDKINALLNFIQTNYNSETNKLTNGRDVADELSTLHTLQLYNTADTMQKALWDATIINQQADGGFGTGLYDSIAAFKAFAQPDLAITSLSSIDQLQTKLPAGFKIHIKNTGYKTVSDASIHQFIDSVAQDNVLQFSSIGLILEPNSETDITLNYADTLNFVGDTSFTFYAEATNESDYENNWKNGVFTFAGSADNTPGLPMFFIANKHSISGVPSLNVRWPIKTDPNRQNYVIGYRAAGAADWNFIGIADSANGAFLYGGFAEGGVYEVTAGVLHKDLQLITYFNNYATVQTSGNDALYTGSVTGVATVHKTPTAGIYTYGYGVSGKSDENGVLQYQNVPNGTSASYIDTPWYEKMYTKFSIPVNSTSTGMRTITRLKPDTTAPVVDYAEIRFEPDYKVKNQQEVEMLAYGSDNVSIKEADFYTYNPHTDLWSYLGTFELFNTSQVLAHWYIGPEELGTGYKIKAIFYDYQGNASAPKEWEPFEIIDGTTPTGTIQVNDLTNNEWAIGETKTIQWTLSTANPIANINSVRLYRSGNYEYIAQNVALDKTTVTYTMPLNSSFVSDDATVSIDVCDTNANCTIITSDPFIIVDKTPPPHAPWSIPELYGPFGQNSYTLYRSPIRIFHNENGSVETVYRETESSGGGTYQRIVYRNFNGTTWNNPIVIAEALNTGANDISYSNFDVFRKSPGTIHIAYEQQSGWGLEGLDSGELYYARVANGTLAASRKMTNDNTKSGEPQLVVTNDDTVFIAYKEGYSYVNKTGAFRMHVTRGDGGNNWTDQIFTDTHTGISDAIIENDRPIILYENNSQMHLMRYDSSWSPSVSLDKPSTSDTSNFRLFTRADGSYDMFYLQGLPETNYKYNIHNLRLSVDFGAGQSTILSETREIMDKDTDEYIRLSDIVRNTDGTYHIFAIRRDMENGNDYERVYHMLYDNGKTYFLARVSPLVMNVDYLVIGTYQSGIAHAYFAGWGNGNTQVFTNTANFNSIINDRIDIVSPKHRATVSGAPITLDWDHTGAAMDSYDVLLGKNPYYMETVATGLTKTDYTATGLEPGALYYWQIIGHRGAELIYSSPWQFLNHNDLTAPSISNLGVSTNPLLEGTTSTIITLMATDASSTIAQVEYRVQDSSGNIITDAQLGTADGAFDEPEEFISSEINTTAWKRSASPYTIFARAKDSAGNWSPESSVEISVRGQFARWMFDEKVWTGATGQVIDSVGTNHATAYGGLAQSASSTDTPTAHLNFDGLDDYVRTPVAFTTASDLSISAWYNTDNTGKSRMALVGGNNGGRFEIYIHEGKPGCRIWDTADRSIYATSSPALGKWHQVICTQHYGTNPETRLYVDGVLKAKTPYASVTAGGYWHAGKPGSSAASYYQGKADLIVMYDMTLNDQQAQSIYEKEKTPYMNSTSQSSPVIGDWLFNENTWTGAAGQVIDSSGINNHGTAYGGLQTTQITAQNRAAQFDGIDDYISTPIGFNTTYNLTVSAWYKTTDTGTRRTLVGGNSGGRFEVYVHDGKPGCRVWDTAERSIYASKVYLGEWTHVACVQTYGTSPKTELYVNGTFITSTPNSSISAGGKWFIGKPGSSAASYFNGLIDHPSIIGKALTATEIAASYASMANDYPIQAVDPNILAYWKFDESSWTGKVSEVIDSSGNGQHSTAKNGAVTVAGITQSGMVGKFDGINDYIDTPLAFKTDTPLVISAWYNTANTTTPRMTILGGNNGGRFEMFVDKGKPGCRVWDTSEKNLYSATVAVDGWHHIACVQTYGTTPKTELYVDGVLKKSVTAASVSAGGTWRVGMPGSSIGKYFDGYIDAATIHKTNLSAEAIAQLYQSQKQSYP